jgi:hypothetical protein
VVFWLAAFVATAARHNGWLATLPLIFLWTRRWSGWRRIAVLGGASLALLIGAMTTNSVLADKHESPWISVAIHDVMGVTTLSGAPLEPSWCDCPRVESSALEKNYEPVFWKTPMRKLKLPMPEERYLAALKSQWIDTVLSNPGAYVEHRLRTFGVVLAITRPPFDPVLYERHPPRKRKRLYWPIRHDHGQTWVQVKIESLLRWLGKGGGGLYQPWLYMLLALVLLPLAFLWRHGRLEIAMLLMSGLLCELSLVIMAPSGDYRYSIWMIVTVLVASGVMARDFFLARRMPSAASGSDRTSSPPPGPKGEA